MKRKAVLCLCLTVFLWALAPLFSGCQNAPYDVGFVHAEESEDGYATVYVPDDRDAKVLLLADPQLDPTQKYAVVGSYNDLTLTFLDKFLDAADPDLVVVAGDLTMSVILNSWLYFCEIADIFEEKKIPWTFVFGNHDCKNGYVSENASAESGAVLFQMTKPRFIEAVREKYAYCLIYSGECADGYGNHVVNVRNVRGKLLQTICNLDCTYEGDKYSRSITQAQTDYYVAAIEDLCAREKRVVPSIVVTHVPLPEIYLAYREIKAGTGDGKYFYGEILEFDDPNKAAPSPFFDELLRLGSTKAVFFGHHHGNDASLSYKGIRLTFIQHSGMSHEYRVAHSEKYGTLGWPADTVFDFTEVDVYGDRRGGDLVTIERNAKYSFAPLYAAEVIPDYAEWAIDYDAVAAQLAEKRGEEYVVRGK